MKSFLSFFCISLFSIVILSGAYAQTNSVEDFKQELKDHITPLGEAMVEVFDADTSAGVNFIRGLQNSDLYQTCTDPGWFTSKRTQISACSQLASKMKEEMPRDRHTGLAEEEVQERHAKLEAFILSLRHEGRADFSESIREALVLKYNEHRQTLSTYVNETNQANHNRCFNLELAESVKCAFRGTLHALEIGFPRLSYELKEEMDEDVRNSLHRIETFEDSLDPSPTDPDNAFYQTLSFSNLFELLPAEPFDDAKQMVKIKKPFSVELTTGESFQLSEKMELEFMRHHEPFYYGKWTLQDFYQFDFIIDPCPEALIGKESETKTLEWHSFDASLWGDPNWVTAEALDVKVTTGCHVTFYVDRMAPAWETKYLALKR